MKRTTTTGAGELTMIKNLLEEDAAQTDRSEAEKEKINGAQVFETGAPQYVEVNEAEDLLETSAIINAPYVADKSVFDDEDLFQPSAEETAAPQNLAEISFNQPTGKSCETLDETKNFTLPDSGTFENSVSETVTASDDFSSTTEPENKTPDFIFPADSINQQAKIVNEDAIFQKPAESQSFAETARQNGLAYAAAVTLFASVVFMLIVGWFADLLFGSSPWGKVGGIVIGSLIGFVQLFRITSQIFKR